MFGFSLVWWITIPSFDYQEKGKSKKKIPVGGYEEDLENTEKILPLAPKKPRKSKQINVISEQETSDSSKSSETDDNPMLSVIQDKEVNLFSRSSKWEHSSEFEDMISASSDNEWLP